MNQCRRVSQQIWFLNRSNLGWWGKRDDAGCSHTQIMWRAKQSMNSKVSLGAKDDPISTCPQLNVPFMHTIFLFDTAFQSWCCPQIQTPTPAAPIYCISFYPKCADMASPSSGNPGQLEARNLRSCARLSGCRALARVGRVLQLDSWHGSRVMHG